VTQSGVSTKQKSRRSLDTQPRIGGPRLHENVRGHNPEPKPDFHAAVTPTAAALRAPFADSSTVAQAANPTTPANTHLFVAFRLICGTN
jgi:hypothetical protein